ncbi:hypothetical protein [Geothrix sp. PMB-07]|uniref:hypothetical protein n=1 Tax=Geothrix sp. PMB-07 TaxID=3068640 RepID=UPI002740CE30|nr:hypothetical protein [Geothrix sp. PMB-07]WLT30223.1 hypothetical protein Q9293_10885 [Geothrix sp. PMB-07]
MKARLAVAAVLLAVLLGVGGFVLYQDTLVPVPLATGQGLFVPANPEFGEDSAQLEALLPASPALEAFLANQSDLTLLEKDAAEAWVGQLLTALQTSRHGRRWRMTLRSPWRLQDGSQLQASRVGEVLAREAAGVGADLRVIDSATLELRFKQRREDVPQLLARWRIPGSGPFLRRDHTLTRFEGFTAGRSGIAGLSVVSDPALLESHAWAQGLTSGRWAWAVFPGHIAPEDMAKVRLAGYDELRLKDGSVWFLSRRLRRLRPQTDDWTRTRLFGVWKGAMDLPYDPLGL